MKSEAEIKQKLEHIAIEKERINTLESERKITFGMYSDMMDKLEARENALLWILEERIWCFYG